MENKIFAELIDSMPSIPIPKIGIEYAIVDAARISTRDPRQEINEQNIEGDKRLIRFLWKNKHTSPFEMIQFKFKIQCPRVIGDQIRRHRWLSLNEYSQRYSEVPQDFYHKIDKIRKQDPKRKQCSLLPSTSDYFDQEENDNLCKLMNNQMETSLQLYKDLLEKGVAKEQARFILPQSTMTSFIVSVNLHNLFHFIRLRSAPDAQPEIQIIANNMLDQIKNLIPTTYECYMNEEKNKLSLTIKDFNDEKYELYILTIDQNYPRISITTKEHKDNLVSSNTVSDFIQAMNTFSHYEFNLGNLTLSTQNGIFYIFNQDNNFIIYSFTYDQSIDCMNKLYEYKKSKNIE